MAHHWLSQGAEVLVRELQAAAAQAREHDCDLLIVGSGYGGAVSAARLAGARPVAGGVPIRVIVLERGREYLPGMFPTRFADLPGHVRFSGQDGAPAKGRGEGLFDLRLGSSASVLVANGLGGGSLINAAVMARPPDESFATGWPQGIDAAALAPAYAEVERMLQVSDFPGTPDPPKLAALFETGRAMGAERIERARLALCPPQPAGTEPPPSSAGVARGGCLQCGDCVTGCNHRAKQSLDVNYLKHAHANGARLYCGATVHDLLPRDDGGPGWRVRFFFTDRSKGYADAPLFTLRARRVVLAAGALGSTEILLRSAPRLGASTRIGQGFSGNGDAIAAVRRQAMPAHCSGREGDAPRVRGIGPTINGMVFKRHAAAPDGASPWLLFQEFAIPGALRRVLAEVTATAGQLFDLQRADPSQHRADTQGEDPAVAGDAAIEHTAIVGMQGDDRAAGALRLVATDDGVIADGQIRIDGGDIGLYPVQLDQLRDAQSRSGRLGGTVVPNPLWEFIPLSNTPRLTTTVHPLGGCCMADDAAQGVVDACGRVRKAAGGVHDDLVVLDGAIVPRALGVNPALTIAALAEHALPQLRRCWKLAPPPAPAPHPSEQPAWAEPPPARPPAPTRVDLHERMRGTLAFGEARYDAGLVVAFAPIDDLAGFVARLPRTVALPRAVLDLRGRDGRAVATLTLSGRAQVLQRVDTSAAERVAAVARERGEKLPEPGSDLAGLYSQIGEVRAIDYHLAVEHVEAAGAEPCPLRPGDRLVLRKRLAYSRRSSPWRQLGEAEVEAHTAAGSAHVGRLCLDPGWFAEQAIPLVRVLAQQDQPNALGDLGALALLAARLVLKTHLLNMVEALDKTPPETAADQRLPGLLRYRDGSGDGGGVGDTTRVVEPERVALGGAPARALLSRYLPPGPPTGRPVLLIHGLGASGSTFAHWSIGADADRPDAARSEPLLASLLRSGREVWLLELRTSIALEQRRHWPLEEVAAGDIGPAIAAVLERCQRDGRAMTQVDVVAHCIGAAMFCVAALAGSVSGSLPLHRSVGAAVLSQVGPLLRLGPMNRLRGYLASYLRQFVGTQVFDVRPPAGALQQLTDALLATFPYPEGDAERERAEAVPGFEIIRHRADAVWGLLMRLDNIGDQTLATLDAIYGWVVVETLAQTIHFARHRLLTDASGANRVIAQHNLAERFAFPVLLLHGQDNAVFDWQGNYDSLWLLKQTFEDADGALPVQPPAIGSGLVLGAGTRRQLRVVAGYGHQDCLIGTEAHRDVFPHVLAFLDAFASGGERPGDKRPPTLVADLPWFGPTLGWVRPGHDGVSLACRLGLRASPARAATRAIVFVPMRREDGAWRPDPVHAVVRDPPSDLVAEAIDVRLDPALLPAHAGFAVLTLHNDIPVGRGPDLRHGTAAPPGLFVEPRLGLDAEERAAVDCAFERLGQHIDQAIVRLDVPWAVDLGKPAPGNALRFVLASCQYPHGLVDRAPAEASYQRLAQRLVQGEAAPQWLLLVGDQIYADETAGLFDPGDGSDIDRSYELSWRLPGFRAATRTLPCGFMLDDHEIADNWEPGRAMPDREGVARALGAYRAQQHKLLPDGAADAPFRFRIFPAGFPVFGVDARTRRQARRLGEGTTGAPLEHAAMLPVAVLDELAAWLAACPPDAPKFIASPSVVLPLARRALDADPAERLGLDDWSGYAATLAALLGVIARGEHRHVVFLSGDAHLSLVGSLALELGAGRSLDVHTVVSSGLYAPWPFANAAPQDLALDGPVAYAHAAGLLAGRMSTAVCGTAQGFAIVSVQRTGERWQLAVELDLADGRTLCERALGPGGGPWRSRRL